MTSDDRAAEIKRWLATIGAIGVFFVGGHIPLPGVSAVAVGGGVSRHLALLALGVTPIVLALVVTEIVRLAVPPLARRTAGPRPSRRQARIARGLALAFGAFQACGVAIGLEAVQGAVDDPGISFRIEILVVLVGATAFLMWLIDAINAYGVGDGLVVLLAASVVGEFPAQAANAWNANAFLPGYVPVLLLALVALSVAGLVAFSSRASPAGPLDLWSLMLGSLLFRWIGPFLAAGPSAGSPGVRLVELASRLSGGDLAPPWILTLVGLGVAFHIVVAAGFFALAAARRASVSHIRLDGAAWRLLAVEFAVWLGWRLIAELTPAPVADGLGFAIVVCVAAALSVLPQWRGGRALAPG